MKAKKIPRARAKDTLEDLHEDGMVGSGGWQKIGKKKHPKQKIQSKD